MGDEERRNARRQRILKVGRIIPLDNNQSMVKCTVRDVSDTGARLKCGDELSAPRQFLLRIGQEATMRPARVAWRRGNEVGILFTGDALPVPHGKPK